MAELCDCSSLASAEGRWAVCVVVASAFDMLCLLRYLQDLLPPAQASCLGIESASPSSALPAVVWSQRRVAAAMLEYMLQPGTRAAGSSHGSAPGVQVQ